MEPKQDRPNPDECQCQALLPVWQALGTRPSRARNAASVSGGRRNNAPNRPQYRRASGTPQPSVTPSTLSTWAMSHGHTAATRSTSRTTATMASRRNYSVTGSGSLRRRSAALKMGSPNRNLDTLAHWARTLRIPPELLWFKLPGERTPIGTGHPPNHWHAKRSTNSRTADRDVSTGTSRQRRAPQSGRRSHASLSIC